MIMEWVKISFEKPIYLYKVYTELIVYTVLPILFGFLKNILNQFMAKNKCTPQTSGYTEKMCVCVFSFEKNH